jgi:regulator of replication initiation timing
MDSKIIGAILVFTILGAGAGFFVSKNLYDPQFLEFESVIDDLDTQISLISQILAQTEEENADLELSLMRLKGTLTT